MSKVGWKLTSGEVATGTAAKTILQCVAAANHALSVREIGISFKGTSNTATPILVQIARQSTAGTSSAATPVKDPDDSDETLQVTGRKTATVEPTTGDVIDEFLVHPQNGYTWQAPYGQEIKVGGGDRLGVIVTAAADVNCVVSMKGEE